MNLTRKVRTPLKRAAISLPGCIHMPAKTGLTHQYGKTYRHKNHDDHWKRHEPEIPLSDEREAIGYVGCDRNAFGDHVHQAPSNAQSTQRGNEGRQLDPGDQESVETADCESHE